MGCELLGTFLLCLLPPLIIDNQTLANNDSSRVNYKFCFSCICFSLLLLLLLLMVVVPLSPYHWQPDFGEQ